MNTTILSFATALSCAFPALASAQGSAFQTPGMPRQTYGSPPGPSADPSQASRFSSVFNPAFAFLGDFVADYQDTDGASDGFDLRLRVLEFGAQAWVDPDAWAYFIAAAEEEGLDVEEGALHYTGLGGNHTLRAGRFFADFGKQMQTHVHELRTLERPLVLRTFLGDEVKGDGVQWDDWVAAGDSTAVRWSVAAFSNLLPESEADPASEAIPGVDSPKRAGDLNFAARLTGFTDVGEHGTLQLGASARIVPSYALTFEPSGDSLADLDNTVTGLDLTYGWKSETGVEAFTCGGEYLLSSGDTGWSVTDVGGDGDPTNDTIAGSDETLHGWLSFADYAFDPFHSVGLQYSSVELPDGSGTDACEVEAYFTHSFSEFHRLRLSLSQLDVDGGADVARAALQYTFIVGAHGHGVNW